MPAENHLLAAYGAGMVLPDKSDAPRAVRDRVFRQMSESIPTLCCPQRSMTVPRLDGPTTGQTFVIRVTAINSDSAEGPNDCEQQFVVLCPPPGRDVASFRGGP